MCLRKKLRIVPSVSYAMANVAKNLKASKGDNIVIADEQFPSNVYAWRELEREKGIELKLISPPITSEDRGKQWNELILESIDSNTKMVSTGHVHWADGTLFDLAALRKRTDEVGAILVIDGTQSIGAMPFDVQKFKPDAVVAAGYKWLMGPYSSGVAYFGEYFADGRPIENNWINRLNSEKFAGLVNYQDEYQSGSIRYEVGESANFILTPMLTRALKQVNEWTPAGIQEYLGNLTAPYLAELRDLDIQIEKDAFRAKHLYGLRLPDHMNLDEVKANFTKNHIYVSIRGNSIRVSPHLYNGERDMERLVQILKSEVAA